MFTLIAFIIVFCWLASLESRVSQVYTATGTQRQGLSAGMTVLALMIGFVLVAVIVLVFMTPAYGVAS